MAAIALAGESTTVGPDGVLVPGSRHQTQQYHSGGFVRFATAALGTNSDDTFTYPFLIHDYRMAIIAVKGDTVVLDAGEELDLYFQTTYDGINWVDVRNVHYANADPLLPSPYVVVTIMGMPADQESDMVEGELGTSVFLDGTLADDTEVDLPLGIGLRLRVKTTNAATGNLNVSMIVK